MIKRISLLAAALVVAVLAIQLLTRTEPAPVPPPPTPREELPAIDPAPEPALPLPEPSDPEPHEDVARFEPAALRKFERRFMFDCDGNQFFVRIGDDEARLLPPGSLTGYYIPLAPAGRSTWRGRYANETIVFRHDGDVGGFELGEQKFDDCVVTRDRAALAEVNTGVTFQGFGHSPTWTFEIVVPEGFVLTAPRGARHVVPFREPIDSGAKITFRSVLGTQELVAVVDRIPCLDAPSGETFANTVTVTFDDEWYYGCGRFIAYR